MEYIIKDYYGTQRKLYKTNCKVCKNVFYVRKHKINKIFYCSIRCRGVAKRKWVTLECVTCKVGFSRRKSNLGNCKSGFRFCTKSCKAIAQGPEGFIQVQPHHYKNGKTSYRQRAIKIYGPVCGVCGYDELQFMLDVDHIDNNRGNNEIKNLQVLCVWCHALKTRKRWAKNYKEFLKIGNTCPNPI